MSPRGCFLTPHTAARALVAAEALAVTVDELAELGRASQAASAYVRRPRDAHRHPHPGMLVWSARAVAGDSAALLRRTRGDHLVRPAAAPVQVNTSSPRPWPACTTHLVSLSQTRREFIGP